MDYMGNTTEYYNSLLSNFENEFNNKLKPITDNSDLLIGNWKLTGHNFTADDNLALDEEQKITKSKSYQYYKIPKQGVLSLWSHYEANPEFGLEEGYEENALYAHWVNENTIHLSNPDSSLQWLLVKNT